MKAELVNIKSVKPNPENPRVIRDAKFKRLVKSVKDFPEMLQIRPIVVNDKMITLGGNMRLKACEAAGYKEVYILKADNLTPEQQREFIVKDNVGFGDWDWDKLANEWPAEALTDWGLDVWVQEDAVDYSALEGEDEVDADVADMEDGVKRAVQIEFDAEHYEEAAALIKFWRKEGLYVGGFIMEKLKLEKDKLENVSE